MKKYTVEVNGTDYEVIIKDEGEAVSEPASGGEASSAPKKEVNNTNNTDVETKDTNVQTDTVDSEDMVSVEAPMTGTILSIKVDKGDTINQGETIMTLEAMKMETEISAPVSGEIGAIKVKEGDHCENGKVIALIKEAG